MKKINKLELGNIISGLIITFVAVAGANVISGIIK